MAAYLVHPNRQIREGVARFFYLISAQHEACKPILSTEEFYCFVRPRLRAYFREKQDIFNVESEKDILDKLRPPLSARLMVVYFKTFSNSSGENSVEEKRKYAEFAQDNNFNDVDTLAYTLLEPNLKKRLDKLRRRTVVGAT